MISTSARKEKEAREHLGADNFIISKNEEQMTVRPVPAPSMAAPCTSFSCVAAGTQAPAARCESPAADAPRSWARIHHAWLAAVCRREDIGVGRQQSPGITTQNPELWP